MELVTAYTLSLYLLTAFAGGILGAAEEGWIPVITIPLLLISYVFTDSGRGWYLPPWLANVCGALSVAMAAFEFIGPAEEAKLLSGAHLLVYSTWIVMFQEKTLRVYWWVMALGILQVAVASVLTNASWFGLCLLLYFAAALWTMSLASLYQARQQFLETQARREATGRRTLVGTGSALEVPAQWITWRLAGGIALLTFSSMLVGAVFFAFTPRIWFGPRNFLTNQRVGPVERDSTTGFAQEIRLGDLGNILESRKPVLNFEPFDAQTGDSIDLDTVLRRLGMAEPLFRGSVMTEYRRGRWLAERGGGPLKNARVFTRPGFRIDVNLEPTNGEWLFTLGSPEACALSDRTEATFLHPTTGLLSREAARDGGTDEPQPVSYRLFVSPLTPELARIHGTPVPAQLWWQVVETGYLKKNLRYSDELTRLEALARELINQAEVRLRRSLTDLEKAETLERHLRDSGEFGYTIKLSIEDPTIDPVEDFLFNRKEGHCEYFASALVLMLRAVNVPARLVSGFKGATPTGGENRWEVLELHSHAWVEAWTGNNVWVTLDPTPGLARVRTLAEVNNDIGFWERIRATTTDLWSDYVVNVNLQKQQESIYGPLRDYANKAWALLQQAGGWGPLLWGNLQYLLRNPAAWFSPTGGLLAILFAACGYGLFRALRWFARIWATGDIQRAWRRRQQSRQVVAFYDRFQRLMQKQGLRREQRETPQEFAELVAQQLSGPLQASGLLDFPHKLVRAFYRVRYGAEELPAQELQHFDQQFSQLEALLNGRSGKTA